MRHPKLWAGGNNGATLITETDAEHLKKILRVVQLLEGKWTVAILYTMRHGPVRFGQLKRAIPQASKKALTSNLRSLEDARIVERRDPSGVVLHVKYLMSERARVPITMLLNYLLDWSSSLGQ